jgi:tetratricopeptide (TPR) repeat protein
MNWLSHEETGRWLIVLDNADDEDVFFSTGHDVFSGTRGKSVAAYIPHSREGSVLITTRDRRVGQRIANRVQPIDVPPFDPQEALHLLESLVGEIDSADEADVVQLLDDLAHLPLAISQAAAFITENSIGVAEYLELLREGEEGMKNLLSEELRDSRRDDDTKNSVIRTWKISFDHIRRSKPRAAEILSLASTLDRQGIPNWLLRQDGESSIEFTKAIGTLQAFFLVTTESSHVSIEVHRLVHLATQKWLELEGHIKHWREEGLKVISEHYPLGVFENWAVCNALTAHVRAVVEYAGNSESCQLYAANILAKAVHYDLSQGRHDVALDKCLSTFKTHEVLLGPEHPYTLTSLGNLASTYHNQGRWAEAEALNVQVMETHKRVLGVEHPDTLRSMGNLASTYGSQGRWAEAEALEVQVIETRKRVFGAEHPDTLRSISNLASTYRDQGRWAKAEALYVQVMETRKRVVGAEHPDTLISMGNLASTYLNQGRWGEAEALNVQVMETRKRVLGVEHPSTLTSMGNVASTYWSQGRWAEAEALNVQVVETRKRVLGAEHPDTLASMGNLAWTLKKQGRGREAIEMLALTVQLQRKVLGPEHPDSIAADDNLRRWQAWR